MFVYVRTTKFRLGHITLNYQSIFMGSSRSQKKQDQWLTASNYQQNPKFIQRSTFPFLNHTKDRRWQLLIPFPHCSLIIIESWSLCLYWIGNGTMPLLLLHRFYWFNGRDSPSKKLRGRTGQHCSQTLLQKSFFYDALFITVNKETLLKDTRWHCGNFCESIQRRLFNNRL